MLSRAEVDADEEPRPQPEPGEPVREWTLERLREASAAAQPERKRRRRGVAVAAAVVLIPATVVAGYAAAEWQSGRDDGTAAPAGVTFERGAGGPASPGDARPTEAPVQEPRAFAWPPVEGAVAYRVEFFRGNQQVLAVRTEAPRVEVPSRWRHAGKEQRLSPGVYRWYVWPVRPGRRTKDSPAIVQARLEVTDQAARQRPGGAADDNPPIT